MELTGWGRFPKLQAQGHWFEDESRLAAELGRAEGIIPHGMGRSYGDSALNRDVLLTGRFNCVLDFDPETGLLTTEAGATLAEIIDAFLPQGFFPEVTPGTKFITVGGAIASDVHGKNHHLAGCFSNSVEWLDLMDHEGGLKRCSRSENPDLFKATCGGMGLTGVILRAGIRLKRIPSAFIRERVIVARHLDETFQRFEENKDAPYSVAWIDCLAKEPMLGRSVLNVGWHEIGRELIRPPSKKLTMPLDLPGFILNRITMSLFNELNYHWAKLGDKVKIRHLEGFFYPLDAILQWNRLYGRKGFTQYQMVLPKASSKEGLRQILTRVSDSGLGAFLGVLKLLGKANDNFLSFPLEGYTLALDFKIQPGLFALLDELDRIVIDHGGRLYLTKDARMRPEILRQGYPAWERFAELRARLGLIKKFRSLQSERLEV